MLQSQQGHHERPEQKTPTHEPMNVDESPPTSS
jgi:hypothetical protein